MDVELVDAVKPVEDGSLVADVADGVTAGVGEDVDEDPAVEVDADVDAGGRVVEVADVEGEAHATKAAKAGSWADGS